MKLSVMKKIAVICGGYSGEHDISVQSGNIVVKNLVNKYELSTQIIKQCLQEN